RAVAGFEKRSIRTDWCRDDDRLGGQILDSRRVVDAVVADAQGNQRIQRQHVDADLTHRAPTRRSTSNPAHAPGVAGRPSSHATGTPSCSTDAGSLLASMSVMTRPSMWPRRLAHPAT